jgi:hypothetical protein
MKMNDLSQLALAYSMHSRLAVTAALEKVAGNSKERFDLTALKQLSDNDFWVLLQSTLDKMLSSIESIALMTMRSVK